MVLQTREDGAMDSGVVVAEFDARPSFNQAVAVMKKAGFERAAGVAS